MDDFALLDEFDSLAGLRNGLRRIAEEKAEWAGIPMPIEGQRLVVEPRYPNAAALSKLGRADDQPDNRKVRNSFWSWKKRSDVVIYEEDGRLLWGLLPGPHHFSHDLSTLGAADVWGIEQEARAVQTLATLLRHRSFKHYMLTGMFLETSRRSGVTYMFRRLKPTVAISTNGTEPRILCALCLHPIAYYEGSWAGAMCPTDDVIAHLMLMRGDEPMFWRRANQHAPYRAEAGL